MSNKTMSDNACYARYTIAAPLGDNTPQNRMSINLYAYSDVSTVSISLYERDGYYWYSFKLEHAKTFNSVRFVSLQNCVAALRGVVRDLGFTLDNSDCLSRFVRAWDRQGRRVA